MPRRVSWIMGSITIGLALGWALAMKSYDRSVHREEMLVAIQDVLKVAVTEVRLSQIFEVKKDNLRVLEFPIPMTDQKSLVIVSGKALVGFDLKKVSLDEKGPRHYLLRLPEPSLLSLDLQYRFVDEKDGWLNRISPEDRNETLRSIRDQVEKDLQAALEQYSAVDRAKDWIGKLAKFMNVILEVEG